jgi:hypothetical protein
MSAVRRGLGAVVTALLLLAAAPEPASAQAGSKCSALKMKAAGAYFQAQARCRAKSVAKGQPEDPVCLVDASDKLARAVSKAERRGDCLTLEVDLPVSQALVEAGEDVDGIIAPTCCQLGSSSCAWLSDNRCLGRGGTLGAQRTVCSGTGTCVPPPAAVGNCCEGSFPVGGGCVANVLQTSCETTGGTHFTDAICMPNRECEGL